MHRAAPESWREFRVNGTTTNDQSEPSIAMDPTGRFVITWSSYSTDGGNMAFEVYAQRYSASGAAQGSEFRVNTYTTGTQGGFNLTAQAVAADASDYSVHQAAVFGGLCYVAEAERV